MPNQVIYRKLMLTQELQNIPSMVYPLDGQPTPVCALSIQRKLSGTYAGDAMGLRVYPNPAVDFGFLPNGNVNNAAILAYTGGIDPTIQTLYDQGGNSLDLIAYADTSEAVLNVNGYGGGINQTTVAVPPYYILSSTSIGEEYECIGVVNYPVLGQEFGFASSQSYCGYFHTDGVSFFCYSNPSFWSEAMVPPLTLNTWYVIRVKRSSNTVTLYINGIQISTQTITYALSPATILRFPGETAMYTNYQFIEFYLFDQILSDPVTLENNIMAYYSI